MSQQVAITLFLKKVNLNDLKLCLTFHYNITGRSQHQVLFFQWQGTGPARTWRSAATGGCGESDTVPTMLHQQQLDIKG